MSRNLSTIVMLAMTAVSFTNLFGLSVAGTAVILGVVGFFVNKVMTRQAFAGSGLDFRAIGRNLGQRSIWFWMAMPLVMDAISIVLARLLLPEYIDHVLARTKPFVTLDNSGLLLLQLLVLALGEEIAWRAFFQKQLHKALPIAPVLIGSSLLFAIGHIQRGSFIVVAYDVFFVFVNSVLYGVIFHKTNNAWTSALSHFAANLFSIIVLAFL